MSTSKGKFITSTGSAITGFKIEKELGAVSAQTTSQPGFLGNVVGAIRGKNLVHESAFDSALERLQEICEEAGANGAIGISASYSNLANSDKIICIIVATAVVFSVNKNE